MSNSTRGQVNRQRIRIEMINKLPDYEGMPFDNAILELAWEFDLAPDTIRCSYMPMFIQKKLVHIDSKNIFHASKGGTEGPKLRGSKKEDYTDDEIKEMDEHKKQDHTVVLPWETRKKTIK